MDPNSYSNIFDTKGIEYLIIIAFLLLVIPFWRYISKPVVRENLRQVIGALTEKILKIPAGLFYNSNHTWSHIETNGNAKVGIDDLLVHLTGELSVVPRVARGERIRKGELLATLGNEGRMLDIMSPVSGELVDFNGEVVDAPSVMQSDPYEKGWLARIKPADWITEVAGSVTGEKAAEWERSELKRFKDFIANSTAMTGGSEAAAIMQAGGEMRDNPLAELPPEVWEAFQNEFLTLEA